MRSTPGSRLVSAVVVVLFVVVVSGTVDSGATAARVASARRSPPHVDQPCTPEVRSFPLPAGLTCRNVTVDGYPRQFLVYVPPLVAADPDVAVPAVVMYHGSGGNGAQFLKISGWRERADREGFVAAFPTGLQYFVTKDERHHWGTKWNSFGLEDDIDVSRRLPGYPADAPWPADDVAFTRAMLDDIASVAQIDTSREYASGFSNGASFVTRLAVDLSDRVAGTGASGGGQSAPAPRDGTLGAPQWTVVGTLDDRFLEAFGIDEIPLDPEAAMSIPKLRLSTLTQLAARGLHPDACSIDRTETMTTWRWCAPDRPEYRLTLVKGLVHHYPNGTRPRLNPSGIAAADLFWPFFTDHPLATV